MGRGSRKALRFTKEIRKHLDQAVCKAFKRAEPWPSDKPRLGAINGTATLFGGCHQVLRDPVAPFGSIYQVLSP